MLLSSVDAKTNATIAAKAMDDKNASHVVVLDIGDSLGVADYFVLGSASNVRLVKTLVDNVDEQLCSAEREPISREGVAEAQWAVLDYGDIVVHVFLDEVRSFYDLERLWGDAPRLDW